MTRELLSIEFNAVEKELARRITELAGRMNNLEVRFEHNQKLNNQIVSALQTGDHTSALRMALESPTEARGEFKSEKAGI